MQKRRVNRSLAYLPSGTVRTRGTETASDLFGKPHESRLGREPDSEGGLHSFLDLSRKCQNLIGARTAPIDERQCMFP